MTESLYLQFKKVYLELMLALERAKKWQGVNVFEIKELQEKNLKFRTAIDSLSTLFLYVPEDLCIKFASIILAKFKRAESTQLVVINEGVLSKMAMIKLNSITDGTIRLNVDEKGERTLKIERMRETRHTLKNLKFKIIDKKGIVIG